MQYLFRDRLIDAQAAKADALAFAAIQAAALASIANHRSFWTGIRHVQHPSATPAAQQARKQSPSATAGFRLTRMPKSVSGNHRLIPFVFVPGNVAKDGDHGSRPSIPTSVYDGQNFSGNARQSLWCGFESCRRHTPPRIWGWSGPHEYFDKRVISKQPVFCPRRKQRRECTSFRAASI